MALLEDGQFRDAPGVRAELGPGYGRSKGHTIAQVVAAFAPDQQALEGFFASRPAAWNLPQTHRIRYGPVLARSQSATPEVEWSNQRRPAASSTSASGR